MEDCGEVGAFHSTPHPATHMSSGISFMSVKSNQFMTKDDQSMRVWTVDTGRDISSCWSSFILDLTLPDLWIQQ